MVSIPNPADMCLIFAGLAATAAMPEPAKVILLVEAKIYTKSSL